MIRYIFRLLALFLPFLPGKTVLAQTQSSDKSLLWQISGKGMKKPSYIFGTIHEICSTDFFWTDAMNNSLSSSDKLCLEMDLDDTAALVRGMGALMDPGKKLSSYFTEPQYSRLVKYAADSMGMTEPMIMYMKPVTIMMMFVQESTAGCATPVSYEEKIMSTAKLDNKEVIGLETMQEQADALSSIPVDTVVKYILKALNNEAADAGDDTFDDLVMAYKAQDIAKLYDLIAASDALGSANGALIDDRNRRWIGRMTKLMNVGESVFFAVGAGHLSGKSGVINLLRKQGYLVSPVH